MSSERVLYQVQAGIHKVKTPKGVKVYKKGDYVASETDLAQRFPNKFVKFDSEALEQKRREIEEAKKELERAESDVDNVEATAKKEASSTEDEKPKKADDKRGENVTDEFEDAGDNDLLVFKTDKGLYTVYDHNEKLNKKKLKDAAAVAKFLADHLKSDDDE